MCKCTPNIRTPFCGKPGCEAPSQSGSKEPVSHGPCAECGMFVATDEYHPFAACLMFKACRNSETVRGNLDAVIDRGYKASRAAADQPSNARVDDLLELLHEFENATITASHDLATPSDDRAADEARRALVREIRALVSESEQLRQDLARCESARVAILGENTHYKQRVAAQQEEIEVADKLIVERNRLLDAIPRCPEHGACVPHAIEWVQARLIDRTQSSSKDKLAHELYEAIKYTPGKIISIHREFANRILTALRAENEPPADHAELIGRLQNISNYEPDDAWDVVCDAIKALRAAQPPASGQGAVHCHACDGHQCDGIAVIAQPPVPEYLPGNIATEVCDAAHKRAMQTNERAAMALRPAMAAIIEAALGALHSAATKSAEDDPFCGDRPDLGSPSGS